VPLRKLAERTATTLTALRQQCARIRNDGYAMSENELENGFSAVAAPVRDFSGRVVAAVSVGGPSSRLRGAALEETIRLTCEAAARMSSQLGFRGDPARGAA
jgi:DNA-binding IclR family transcriptional regulator